MENIKKDTEQMIEEKLPLSKNIVLACQHLFLMNAYVVPVILASIIGLDEQGSSALIQATFLASGITTLLQAKFFMKYPVVYGASFVPMGAIVGIYMIQGGNQGAWSYVVGACLAGAIAIILLGLSKKFKKILDVLVTPVVSATIVLCIGISLIPLAFSSMIFVEGGFSVQQNIIVAIVTIVTMIICSIIGNKAGKVGTITRIGSGIIALVAGYITASCLGTIDLSAVSSASLLSRPALPFLDFDIKFDFLSVITMVVLYFVLMTETVGTWIATSCTTETELNEKRVNNGVVGLGISNVISSLLGTTPMSGYSSNVGILALTNTFSRHVFSYVGILLIIIGFSSKLSSFIAIIPSAAVGGIFLLTSGIITSAGINMFKQINMGSKETYIVSICVILAIGLNILPQGLLESLPVFAQYILGSSIATCALTAIILNKLIPNDK